MARLSESHGCCGLQEMHGLDWDPKENLLDYCRETFVNEKEHAFILLTDAVRIGNGRNLVKYIRRHKLGTVVLARQKWNPVHADGNIEAWIWTPNEVAMRAWWKKNRPNEDDEDDDSNYWDDLHF